MIATLQRTHIDCPEPAALAAFYEEILSDSGGERFGVVDCSPEAHMKQI
ncbi:MULTISPECIES: hypothetical protein [unclassified Streptomyces]